MKKLGVWIILLLAGVTGAQAASSERIFTAVHSGNREEVERLLSKDKTLVYQQDEQGMTPFLAAVESQDLDMAVLLADYFSRLDANAAPGNALHIAVLNEDAPMLRVLFQLFDEEDPDLASFLLNAPRRWGAPGSPSNDGNTPLHLAALKCHRPMYQFLVANGAKPTVRNRVGKTPAQLLKACPPEPTNPAPVQKDTAAPAAKQAVPAPQTVPAKPLPPEEPLVFPLE